MEEQTKILEYIRENFNVDRISMLLMSNIYDYLFDNTMNYLEDFIEIVNYSGIDITIEELKENNIIE
jgi:hypothetical protein